MHQQDRAGSRADRAFEAVEVNLPAVVVDEMKRPKLYVLNRGEKIEERIARMRDEDFVAGLAEQSEEERIRLARAGRQNEMLGIDAGALLFVIANHRIPRGSQAFRVGIVLERVRRA